jgi:hypothetical protein
MEVRTHWNSALYIALYSVVRLLALLTSLSKKKSQVQWHQLISKNKLEAVTLKNKFQFSLMFAGKVLPTQVENLLYFLTFANTPAYFWNTVRDKEKSLNIVSTKSSTSIK